jgi:AcrR family transcriptional regulator
MPSFDEHPKMSEQVLIKAAELIREKGFAATSVNEISQAIGITKGGLYYYIKGKRDLLFQIMKHGLSMIETWTEDVQNIEDPEQQLRMLIHHHVGAIARGKGALTAVSEEVQALDEHNRAEILGMKRSYFNFVRGILDRLHTEGKVRDMDLSVATFNVLGMILHFARWYRDDGRLDPTEVADQIADFAIAGLRRTEC